MWRVQQLTAFLTSLFKAVEGVERGAGVYTLAVGGSSRAADAYSEENQFLADAMAEPRHGQAPALYHPCCYVGWRGPR